METKKDRPPGPPGPGGAKTWSGQLLGRKVFWQADSPEEAEKREQCSELAQLLLLNFFAPGQLDREEVARGMRLVVEAHEIKKMCLAHKCVLHAIGDTGICRRCATIELGIALKEIERNETVI